ncbi:hypothetical protein F383_32038 [Gossypium arboreum]|uniref:Uncharacterized protein n=1 Tax=Gossypium arboreum TaxID=29729 RepID=A0A0B0PMH8_GOSAR|nr:hypothetical protein F383_32038 [Gossypium arboreum]
MPTPRRGLTCNQISMPLSQAGSYTKSNTMPTSQTWSYTITHIRSYVMTYLSYYHSSQYNDIYT